MAGGDWAVNITNLTRGNHRLSVRVIDVAGTTAFSNISFLVDDEPPELELDEPFEQSVVVNRSGVRFRGTAEPGSRIFVGTVEVAESPDGSFDAVVNLSEGQNTVQVFCRDRAQNTASLARTVTVDLTPPPITVFSPTDGYRTRNAEIQLAGRIEPGARFRVDGSTVILGPDGSFDVTISLTGGPKTVELYAEDAASNGNTTQMTITRIIDTQAGGGGLMEKYGLYIALGLVALIVAAAAGAVLVRRRGRGRPPATGGGPAPAAQGGTVLEAIEVVEADK
jgi:hypothetical protein